MRDRFSQRAAGCGSGDALDRRWWSDARREEQSAHLCMEACIVVEAISNGGVGIDEEVAICTGQGTHKALPMSQWQD